MKPVDLILTMLALAQMEQPITVTATTRRKEIVKRVRVEKQKRPGRGKPAKGYDPETRTWTA